jgi:hypothetical protein
MTEPPNGDVTQYLDKMIFGLVERIKALETKVEEKQAENLKISNQLQYANAKCTQLQDKLQIEKNASYDTGSYGQLDVLKSNVEHLEQLNDRLILELEKSKTEITRERDEREAQMKSFDLQKEEMEELQSKLDSMVDSRRVLDLKLLEMENRISSLAQMQPLLDKDDNSNSVEKSSNQRLEYSRLLEQLQNRNQDLETELFHRPEIQMQQENYEIAEQKNLRESGELLELIRQKTHFLWKATHLQSLLNICRKEFQQEKHDLSTHLARLKFENQRLTDFNQNLEDQTQQLRENLVEIQKGGVISTDLIPFYAAVQTRLESALFELEHVKNHESHLFNEISKKNMEIAILATRVYELEEMRQVEQMEFQNLQDELFFCKQNYKKEIEALVKNHNDTQSEVKQGSMTSMDGSVDESSDYRPTSTVEAKSERKSIQHQFLPSVMLLQTFSSSLEKCMLSKNFEEVNQGLHLCQDTLHQFEQLVAKLYSWIKHSLAVKENSVMNFSKCFKDCLLEHFISNSESKLTEYPFSDANGQLIKVLTQFNNDTSNFQKENNNSTKENEFEQLLYTLQELRVSHSNLQKKVLQKEVQPLQVDIEALKSQSQKNAEQCQGLEQKLDEERKNVAKEFALKEAKEQSLHNSLSILTQSNQELGSLNHQLLQKIERLESLIAYQSNEIVMKDKTIISLEEYKQQVVMESERNASLKSELILLKRDHDALIQNFETMIQELESYRTQQDSYSKDLEKHSIAIFSHSKEQLSRMQKENELKIEDFETKIDFMETERLEQNVYCKELEHRIMALTNELQDQFKNNNKDSEIALMAQIDGLKSKIDFLELEKSQQDKYLKDFEQKALLLGKTMQEPSDKDQIRIPVEFSTQIQDFETIIDFMETEKSEQDLYCKELEHRIMALTNQLQDQSNNGDREKELVLMAQIEKLESKILEIEKSQKSNVLKSQLHFATSVNEMPKSIALINQLKDDTNTDVNYSQIENYETKIDFLETEKSEQDLYCKELEHRIMALTNQLQDQSNNLLKESEMEKLESKIRSLELENSKLVTHYKFTKEGYIASYLRSMKQLPNHLNENGRDDKSLTEEITLMDNELEKMPITLQSKEVAPPSVLAEVVLVEQSSAIYQEKGFLFGILEDFQYGILLCNCNDTTLLVSKPRFHFYHGSFTITVICMTFM